MTRVSQLPTVEQVQHAKNMIIAEAAEVGERPSVLALARRVGLSNTTLRRHFPDAADDLSALRRTPVTPSAAEPDGSANVQEQIARLRQDKADLATRLELAIASIQHLSLDNDRLRRTLEAANKVTNINTKTRHASDRNGSGGHV